VHLFAITPDVEIQVLLYLCQVVAELREHRGQDILVGPHAHFHRCLEQLVREAVGKIRGALHRLHHGIAGVGTGDEIEDALQEFDGILLHRLLLALLDQLLEHPVQAAEELFDLVVGGELALHESQDQGLGRIHQAAQAAGAGDGVDATDHVQHQVEPRFLPLVTVPAEQSVVVAGALLPDQFGDTCASRSGDHRLTLHHAIQVGGVEHDLGSGQGATRSPQVVEYRKQGQRDVRLALFQPLQVGRKLYQPEHQGFGQPLIPGKGAFCKQPADPLHLLDEHGPTIDLHHAQRPQQLVDLLLEGSDVITLKACLFVRLQRLTGLLQGLVQLRLDPLQGAVIDRCAHAFPFIRLSARRRNASVFA